MLIPALIATELVIILFLAWKAFTAPFGEETDQGFVLDDDAVEKTRNNLPDRGNVIGFKSAVTLSAATSRDALRNTGAPAFSQISFHDEGK